MQLELLFLLSGITSFQVFLSVIARILDGGPCPLAPASECSPSFRTPASESPEDASSSRLGRRPGSCLGQLCELPPHLLIVLHGHPMADWATSIALSPCPVEYRIDACVRARHGGGGRSVGKLALRLQASSRQIMIVQIDIRT